MHKLGRKIMRKPPSWLLKAFFRLSLILNLIFIPYIFMKDHIINFFRNSHSHDWISQPLMNSSLYKAIYQVERTKGDSILKLYQLMKDVHELFDKHHILYWADGGTLLGAIRHQGIIPWDGDLDIRIRFEDGFRFQQLIPEFKKLGYEIDEAYFGFKILLVENKQDRLHNVCCDVFLTSMHDGKNIYYSLGAQERWPVFILESELLPLAKYRFGAIEIWGPKLPEPYLTRLYGNWRTLAYQQQEGHLVAGERSRIPFTPTGKDLEPGKPMGPLEDRVKL
ncbi:MAG: hypothetical protein FJX03_00405 [Alphaproteobacteria bacterium]|nr:hypothetical protein [Alphaproteobacteria bacterium]